MPFRFNATELKGFNVLFVYDRQSDRLTLKVIIKAAAVRLPVRYCGKPLRCSPLCDLLHLPFPSSVAVVTSVVINTSAVIILQPRMQ